MASVFLAGDTVLNREVAVKMVHPHLLHLPETRQRFSNEARAVAALSHGNIIKIFDFGEARSRPFIVMEYIDGITLEELISREGAIPSMVTAGIALQVLSGLTYAHQKGIYHRDIKPGNILIDREGIVRITDFGIAYLVNKESVTLTGSFLGSPHYISPELASNKPVGANTDVFSLGVVLYQCLTGSIPFDADTPHGVIHEILNTDPPCPSAKNAHVLLWLADLVESCLIKDPSQRPGSQELFTRLESLCRNESITAGGDRIASFVNNPAAERAAEAEEIVSHYRQKALAALQKRQIPAALRAFEQASRFGTLPTADRKLIDRLTRHRAMRRAVLICGSAVIGAAILSGITVGFLSDRRVHSPLPPVTSSTLQRVDTAVQEGNASAREQSVQPLAAPPGGTESGASAVAAAKIGNRRGGAETGTDSSADSPRPENVSPVMPDSTATLPTGFFKCYTNPPWVSIYIDNIERGTTPTISALPLQSGKHMLRLVKKGFRTIDETITIAPAETAMVRIRLTPDTMEVSVP